MRKSSTKAHTSETRQDINDMHIHRNLSTESAHLQDSPPNYFLDTHTPLPKVYYISSLCAFHQEGRIQGNNPWVDSACADCPGFLLPGAAPAPPSPFVLGLRLFPWASILLHGPLDICLDVVPAAPLPPGAKTGRTAHVFTVQRGTRRRIY